MKRKYKVEFELSFTVVDKRYPYLTYFRKKFKAMGALFGTIKNIKLSEIKEDSGPIVDWPKWKRDITIGKIGAKNNSITRVRKING